MRILVTGGAGYIGSVAVLLLQRAGHEVHRLDNLSTGHAHLLTGPRAYRVELTQAEEARDCLRHAAPEAVLHFAAASLVAESASNPSYYYHNNLVGVLNLLEAMRAVDCRRLVFSSTAAVYGAPDKQPLEETLPCRPINVYGRTKLAIEWAIQDYAAAYGFGYAIFRYFNAAGALPEDGLGEAHEPETHLIPNVMRAATGEGPALTVFGDDYPTPDGTCIRDYIHVQDLVEAHMEALPRLAPGARFLFNLGTGAGFSVREILREAERVVGRPIPHLLGARRPGDPPVLVAEASKIHQQWGWKAQRSELPAMLESAWRWHSRRR